MTANDTSSLVGQVDDLLQQLTLEEKAALTVGRDKWTTCPIERLGIPSIWLTDGPHGVRKARSGAVSGIGDSLPATCFPTASALAASWDVALVREIAGAVGHECQAQGGQILLGPGVNLKRSPLAGRNFEYFSEDPILSGELAAAYISGLQENGVGASLKHLVANENETARMSSDSVVDERTLHEVYLRPFEIAIAKAQPWSLMAAYNRLNGVYCTEHHQLLEEIVRDDWGYRGIIMSDWYAVNNRPVEIEAGLHLQMPYGPTQAGVVTAVREGRLSEARLDEIVRDLLTIILTADANRRPETTVDYDAHHRLARRAASESIVLLKNENDMLPLDAGPSAEVAVIGAFARQPRYQGAGSSQVVATQTENPYGEMATLLAAGCRLTYAAGYTDDHQHDDALLAEAREIASRARVAVVFVGLPPSFETEGMDREHLDLPEAHNRLVEAVQEVQPATVVVLLNGSAVRLPWVEHVPAIVEGWLGGQATGGAIANVLFGRVNPSGKLSETFPARLEDTPAFGSFPSDGTGSTYFTERLFTGYRWYDARRIAPTFPFGHGLSYTTFEYADLAVGRGVGDVVFDVSVRVRNSGELAGQEIVQLYVHEESPEVVRPERELRAFAKIALDPGEEQVARFALTERDLAIWDPRVRDWRCAGGTFEIQVGASSRDIRQRQRVTYVPEYVVPLPLSRLSSVADWQRHPVGKDLIEPFEIRLVDKFGLAGSDLGMISALIAGFPIGKLVVMGAISEDELTRLIDEANAGGPGRTDG